MFLPAPPISALTGGDGSGYVGVDLRLDWKNALGSSFGGVPDAGNLLGADRGVGSNSQPQEQSASRPSTANYGLPEQDSAIFRACPMARGSLFRRSAPAPDSGPRLRPRFRPQIQAPESGFRTCR